MSSKKINILPTRKHINISGLSLTKWKRGENIAFVERYLILWEKVCAEFKKLGRGGNAMVAARLGKSEAWVSRKMNNKRGVSLKDFLAICAALNIDPGSLFGAVSKPENVSAEEALRALVREEIEKSKK